MYKSISKFPSAVTVLNLNLSLHLDIAVRRNVIRVSAYKMPQSQAIRSPSPFPGFKSSIDFRHSERSINLYIQH